MNIFWMTEAIPFQAVSLLPLIVLPCLDVMSSTEVTSSYFSEPLYLKFLSYFFALAVRGSTTLYTRAAFVLLNLFGTRIRTLLLSFLVCTLILTQLLEASVATLVIVFIVGCAIDEIQNDIIRETRFKAYAQKFRRRSQRFLAKRDDNFASGMEEKADTRAVLSSSIDTRTPMTTTIRVDVPVVEETPTLRHVPPVRMTPSATSFLDGSKGTESKDITTTSDVFLPASLTADASKAVATATAAAKPSRKRRRKAAKSAKKDTAQGTSNQPVNKNVVTSASKRKLAKKSALSQKEAGALKEDAPRGVQISDDPANLNKACADGTVGCTRTPSVGTSPTSPISPALELPSSPSLMSPSPGTWTSPGTPEDEHGPLSEEVPQAPWLLYSGSLVPSPETPGSQLRFAGEVVSVSREASYMEAPRDYMDVTPDFVPSPFRTFEPPETPTSDKKDLTSLSPTARTTPARRVTIPVEYFSETSVSALKQPSNRFFRKTSVMFSSVASYVRRRLTTATVIDTEYLQEQIDWEKGRYTYLQRDVLIGVALTASMGSITNLRGNDCNVYLDKFLQAKYQYRELTVAKWTMLTVPVVLCAVFFCWAILMMGYYERYDAEEDDDARYAISQVLKHRYHSLDTFKKSECVAAVIPLVWWLSTTAYGLEQLTARNTITSPTATVVGSMLIVLCFVLPRNPSVYATSGRLLEWRHVVGSIPWGVMLMYAGSNCVAPAFETSGLSSLLKRFVLELNGMDETACQVVLTILASVLTELLSSTATASILVPLSVDLAELTRVHPLYYAIPVTVASSVSLVMPMSNLAITVVISYAEICIADLLVPGMLTKFFALMVLLVTVNTLGYYVFNLSQFPERFQKVNASQQRLYH